MSYDPPGWYVDSFEQQVPDVIASARKNGLSAVELANILMDSSTDSSASGSPLTHQEHVEALALLAGLLVRRLASQAP